MSNASVFDRGRDRFRSGVADFAGKWGWYLALGIFLTILGFVAAGLAVATTILSVVVLGWILLGAGACLIVFSFLTGRWSGFLFALGAGALSLVAGIELLSNPVSGAVAVTAIIATIFLV